MHLFFEVMLDLGQLSANLGQLEVHLGHLEIILGQLGLEKLHHPRQCKHLVPGYMLTMSGPATSAAVWAKPFWIPCIVAGVLVTMTKPPRAIEFQLITLQNLYRISVYFSQALLISKYPGKIYPSKALPPPATHLKNKNLIALGIPGFP